MAIRITNNNYGGRVTFSSRNLGGKFVNQSTTTQYLLNYYPGAAAAYSLRLLNNNYTGSAIRVRRSSDNAETDIGFTNGQLNTTSLTTFVGTQNNLIPYSEDFTQWSLFNAASVNSNVTTDPIGGNTADRLNFGTLALSQIYYSQTLTNGVTYVVSVYAKSDTKSKFRFKVSDGTTEIYSPDITTTSSWVRYDYTISSAPISNNVAIVNESAGGAGAIFIWGAQVNIRTLQTYTQTTGTAKNNDGFVTKWYDQSGNIRDAIQATTANQPRIVYGGSITYINGKPTVENIANSYLATTQTAFTTLQIHSDFIVTKALTQTQSNDYVGYLVFGPSSGNDFDSNTAVTINTGQISTGKNLMVQGSGYSIIGSGLITQHRLISHIINAQSGQAYSNSVSIGTATGTFSTTNGGSLYIGTRYTSGGVNTSYSYLGYFQEIISYNSNQLTNRLGIEADINSFYRIYGWQGTGTALLDLYPSPAVAYSLRNLSSNYLGPLVRVRRSSDSAEADIYGTAAGQIDSGSMLAFCGAGNGFVTKWYDQSGNGNNAIQTTVASQPQIVTSGAIYTQGTKPSMFFNSHFLSFTDVDIRGDIAYFMVHKKTGVVQGLTIGSSLDGSIKIAEDSDGYFRYAKPIGTNLYSATGLTGANAYIYQILQGLSQSTTLSAYYNGTTISLGAPSISPYPIKTVNSIGKTGTTLTTNSQGQEVIIYNTNQIANRAAIVANINSYYAVY